MAADLTPAQQFEKERFVYIKSFLTYSLLNIAYIYTIKMLQSGKMKSHETDKGFAETPAMYGDCLMDTIHGLLTPLLEQGIGMKLYQSFSYTRVYEKGDSLKSHTDRESGEISVTTNLGYKSAEPWPIYLEAGGTTHEFAMEPGDALIYRGVECPHWREEFTGDHHAQLTIHFVDQNGPYTKFKFDEAYLRSRGELVGDLEVVSVKDF